MKFIRSLIISLAIALLSANAALAKEWRGIVPLHSTRSDVERLLGVPQQSTPAASYYSLTGEIAVVWFKSQSCDSDPFGFDWNVPIGTVTEIGIIPKMNYGKKRFPNVSGFTLYQAYAGFSYYEDESEGLLIEIFKGRMTRLGYTPTEKEADRRCPRIKRCCVDFFSIFDGYENLTFDDEKVRLDNYAVEIKERLSRGVIIIYGKNPIERRKVMRQAGQARKYLRRRHGIEAQRMLIIDGGYKDHSAIQLNLYPVGGVAGNVYIFPAADPEERNKRRL